MNETEIRSLVNDIVSAWNSRDIDRFISHLDEDVIWEDPAMLLGPAMGREGVRQFSESILRAFPDFSYTIREPVCVAESGKRCVVPWEIKATHTGWFEPIGFAPTHQVIRMLGVDVLEFAGGKVTKIETHFNVLPAIEQALRLKPLAGNRVAKVIIRWLQRCRAYWLRRTTSERGSLRLPPPIV